MGGSDRDDVPPVLMIVGTGRSGTTLLEKALGNFGGAVAIGETNYLWERGFLENQRCSDGIPFRDHPVWRSILARAFPTPPDPGVQERLRHRVEHSRLLPLLLLGRRRRDVQAYGETWRALFRAIAEEIGARIIVDASKSPVRAWLLRRCGLDVRVVHVVRDLGGVIDSWSKPKADPGSGSFLPTKHPLVTALYWTVHHLLSILLLGGRAYVRIDLDTFLEAPQETVRRLWQALDLDEPGPSPFVDHRRFRVQRDVAFSGNPDRFLAGVVEVRRPPSRGSPLDVFFRIFGRMIMPRLEPRRALARGLDPIGEDAGGGDQPAEQRSRAGHALHRRGDAPVLSSAKTAGSRARAP